jgi:hypothetical protein
MPNTNIAQRTPEFCPNRVFPTPEALHPKAQGRLAQAGFGTKEADRTPTEFYPPPWLVVAGATGVVEPRWG